MKRLLCLVLLAAAAIVPAGPASAQDNAFGPLAPAATPAPTDTPAPASTTEDGGVGRGMLFAVGGILVVVLGFTGWWISRDARRSLPAGALEDRRLREEGPHKAGRQAKAKRRAKGRAARSARKTTRRRAR